MPVCEVQQTNFIGKTAPTLFKLQSTDFFSYPEFDVVATFLKRLSFW